VVLTAGTQHSLDLCAQLLADVGDTVWMEDPGYWGARCIFEACDLKVEPVGVDAEGMNPALAARGSRPRLVYLTPSNQYPLGVAMSLARRRSLLQIAAREQAWIVEDDYDSELRYSGRPLASLQGLDAEQRVVYVGTFSKVLYPGIKIGYMVVPAALAESFHSALYDLQRPGQLTVQAALADFIERGYFVTHIRRLRQAYAERRELLVGALQSQLGDAAPVSSQAAGLHLVVQLPDGCDDQRIEALAAAHGTTVRALSRYFIGPATARGLVVGFGYAPPDRLAQHGRLLARTIRAALAG
jgi:GntR family transcriptional regulator/MocR family aminotransferase